MELCYKLNIPNFLEIVRDDWKHNLTSDAIYKLPPLIPAQEVVKREHLTFNNINWTQLVRFPLTPEVITGIHSDNYGDTIDENLENPKFILFVINYVVTGSGRIDYYLPSQLASPFHYPHDPYKQKNWLAKGEPFKSYEMSPGAYLLNVTVPHKAVAYDNRLVMSLRPSLKREDYFNYWSTKSWDDIVNSFQNYIQ